MYGGWRGQHQVVLTLTGVKHIAGRAAVGAPDARVNFRLEFLEKVGLALDLNWAGGVESGMAAFAVRAVERGCRAAAGNGAQVSLLWARALSSGAAVLGLGVAFPT